MANLDRLPFLLNPDMPEEGEPIAEHLSRKYGPSAMQRFNDPNSSLRVMGTVGAKGIDSFLLDVKTATLFPRWRSSCSYKN